MNIEYPISKFDIGYSIFVCLPCFFWHGIIAMAAAGSAFTDAFYGQPATFE
jgi:hypothetical protein